jgi:hypothetical protein
MHSQPMPDIKRRPVDVLEFFHSENRNVYVIHCTTTSFEEYLVRVTSICVRCGETGEKYAFVPEHSPAAPGDIDSWESEVLTKFQKFLEKNP